MKYRQEAHAKIVKYVSNHPEITIATIARKMGIGESTLYGILKAAGYSRRVDTNNIDFDSLEVSNG